MNYRGIKYKVYFEPPFPAQFVGDDHSLYLVPDAFSLWAMPTLVSWVGQVLRLSDMWHNWSSSSPSLRRQDVESVLQGNTVKRSSWFLQLGSRRRGCLCLWRVTQVLWHEDMKHWLLSMHLLDATPAASTWAPLRHKNLTEGKWGSFPNSAAKWGLRVMPAQHQGIWLFVWASLSFY